MHLPVLINRLLKAVYTAFQFLLPRGFRSRHAESMRVIVEERTTSQRDAAATLNTWVRELWDLLCTAACLRLSPESRRVAPQSPIPQRGLPMWEKLRYETRLAARSLARNPGFCGVVLVTLALGIGATTTIFSFVNAVLIEPLPYADPEEIVVVWETDRLTGTQREPASIPDFRDFAERNVVLEELSAFAVRQGNLTAAGQDPRQVTVAFASHNLLEVLGLRPAGGRYFTPGEDTEGGPLVALVSHRFWNGPLNRDPEVIGRNVNLDDSVYEIIGILPAGLNFPDAGLDLLAPLQPPADSQRSRHGIGLVGRLRDGVSRAAAQENLAAIALDLEAAYPENRARGVFIEPLSQVLRGEIRPALLVLMGAVVTVLLIACGNVAGLMLARGASRRQEIAVCAALGAGRAQIVRRFLIEALLLSTAGSAVGLAVAFGGLQLVKRAVPGELLARFPVQLDLSVLAFTLAASLLIALGFALLPLRLVRAMDLQNSLQSARGSAAGLRLSGRRLLVVGQVGLAMVLLAGSALLIKSLWELRSVDPGFRADQTLRATFRLPASRYPRDFSVFPEWTEVHSFNRRLLDSAERLPGVRAAALSITHPMDPGWTNSFVIVGREAELRDQGELKTRIVSEDYLRTTGISVLTGRGFDNTDTTESTPVLLVNESAVQRYFPDGNALGQQIGFWGANREIVGVVADVRMHGLREETPPAMYVPIWQAPPTAAETLLVWSSVDPLSLAGPVRNAVWQLDAELAVYDVTTMQSTLSESLAREQLTAGLLIAFGLTALLLAAVGLHGLLSYLVVLRRHEMGVRMALGASRTDVVRLVLTQGARLALVGILLGLPVSLLAARLMSSLLYGISSTDPLSFAAAAVLLGAAIFASALLPARRAGCVDPTSSLRTG